MKPFSPQHTRKFLFLTATIILAVLAARFYFKPLPSDREQAESAHGIILPTSASDVQTVGDWDRGFLDRGATTIFTIEDNQIEQFIASLPETPANGSIGPPSNNIYHQGLIKPWNSEQYPKKALLVESPVGDWLSLEIFQLPSEMSAIRLYTEWN